MKGIDNVYCVVWLAMEWFKIDFFFKSVDVEQFFLNYVSIHTAKFYDEFKKMMLDIGKWRTRIQ